MILRKRLKDPKLIVRIGAAFLLLANLWPLLMRFVLPTSDFWQGFSDGVRGVLFGVSFGFLLLGLRRSKRLCQRDGA